MKFKIYQPSKSAMQSGIKNTKVWCLETLTVSTNKISNTFCWNSSDNTYDQIKVYFDKLDEAILFAQNNNLEFKVFHPNLRKKIKKSYAENFKPKKI